ncbi:hypothetical protein, partial [Fusobacterium sp. PH5-44]|uniref:hypothetical protein n=1 Tax=unclassified Fusobacterium TaxID=2648384 RepID=UPI003D1F94A0
GKFTDQWQVLYAGDGYKITVDYLTYLNKNKRPNVKTRAEIEAEVKQKKAMQAVTTAVYYAISIYFAYDTWRKVRIPKKITAGLRAGSDGKWLIKGGEVVGYRDGFYNDCFKIAQKKLTDDNFKNIILNIGKSSIPFGIGKARESQEQFMDEMRKEMKMDVDSDYTKETYFYAINFNIMKIAFADAMRDMAKTGDEIKITTLLQEIAYFPPPDALRLDLFELGVVILRKEKNIVVCFKNDDRNKIIEKMLDKGYYLEILTYLDIIRKYCLLCAREDENKLSLYNITITGCNIGGELAKIFSLFENNFNCRSFFTDQKMNMNDFVSFNVRDLGVFFDNEYISNTESASKEAMGLIRDAAFTYGGAILTGQIGTAIGFMCTSFKISFSVATFPYLIVASIMYSIYNALSKYHSNEKLSYLYVILCHMGFFECEKLNDCKRDSIKICIYCKKSKIDTIKYPKLRTYDQIMENLNRKQDFYIDKEKITVTYGEYLAIIFGLYNISDNLVTGKSGVTSSTVGVIADKSKGAVGTILGAIIAQDYSKNPEKYSNKDLTSNEVMDGVKSIYVDKVNSQYNVFNLGRNFKLDGKNYVTDTYQEEEKTILNTDLVPENIKEKLNAIILEEGSTVTHMQYKQIKHSYIMLKKVTNGYVGKKIYYFTYKSKGIYNDREGEVELYESKKDDIQIIEEELIESLGSFLWYIQRNIEIQKHYADNIASGDVLYYACGRYRSSYEIICQNRIESGDMRGRMKIVWGDVSKEFAFFPYIDSTTGDIIIRGKSDMKNEIEKKAIYKNLNDNYIGSVVRSILENNYDSKDPKFYTLLEIENPRISSEISKEVIEEKNKEGYKRENYLEKLLLWDSGLVTKFDDESIIEHIMMYINAKSSLSINGSRYSNFNEVRNKINENPNILKKFYRLDNVGGSGGVNKILRIGIMKSNGDADDSEIAYIYNDDCIKRGIIKKEMILRQDSSEDTKSAKKILAKSGDKIICNMCNTRSTFAAKYAIGLEIYDASGEKIEIDNTVGSTTDKRGGEDGSILPFDGVCYIKKTNPEKYNYNIKCVRPETDPNEWDNLSDVEVGDGNALTKESGISCEVGGYIKFVKGDNDKGSKTN